MIICWSRVVIVGLGWNPASSSEEGVGVWIRERRVRKQRGAREPESPRSQVIYLCSGRHPAAARILCVLLAVSLRELTEQWVTTHQAISGCKSRTFKGDTLPQPLVVGLSTTQILATSNALLFQSNQKLRITPNADLRPLRMLY